MTIDELWDDLILDACASDGPIKDRDVRAAVERGRAKIEAAYYEICTNAVKDVVKQLGVEDQVKWT